MKDRNRKGIVLNRMYVGDYLTSNLGHEVINLYQADNGGHYLYLNATGDFVKEHQGQIDYMLFVKYFAAGEVEVIGLAKGLHDVFNAKLKHADSYKENSALVKDQRWYIEKKEGGVSYGGISIYDIFNNAEQQNVFITYKADNVFVPARGHRLFIRFSSVSSTYPSHLDSDIIIKLNGYQQAKASLKQYIYPEGFFPGSSAKEDTSAKKEDYHRLIDKLISPQWLWEKSTVKISEALLNKQLKERPVSLFDICMIQNSENDFSNALSYFMQQPEFRELWEGFFEHICHIRLNPNYSVTREESSKIEDKSLKYKNLNSGGRIDLLIRDENSFLVIENKIKSDLNSVESDNEGLQLERYKNYIDWLSETREPSRKVKKFIILSPNYNIPTIPESMKPFWEIITYKDLYNYLAQNKKTIERDINFVFFRDAMQRHTHQNVNDFLYYEMQEKFFRRIAAAREKSSANH